MSTHKEYVYIAVNPYYRFGLLKIGKTKRTAEERCDELYRGSGVPGYFYVVYEASVDNSYEVEQLVHHKIRKNRFNPNREFFDVPLKEAVKVIEQTIQELATQTKLPTQLSFNDDPHGWWSHLPFLCQQIIRTHLPTDYQPDEGEIIESIPDIIHYCPDAVMEQSKLREKVAERVKKANYQKNIKHWYHKLPNHVRNYLTTFITRDLSEKEVERIEELKELNCNNPAISSLEPIRDFTFLKVLNIKSSNVSTLKPIEDFSNLTELNCNYTPIDSLNPLYGMTSLEKVHIMDTGIDKSEKEEFKKHLPHCKLTEDWF